MTLEESMTLEELWVLAVIVILCGLVVSLLGSREE